MWDGNRTGDAWYVADLLVVKTLQEYVCPLPLTKDAMMVRKTELAVKGSARKWRGCSERSL